MRRIVRRGGSFGSVVRVAIVLVLLLVALLWVTAAKTAFDGKAPKEVAITTSTKNEDPLLPVPTPNVSYKKCADEGSVCKCSGIIRFGHGENWSLRKPCEPKHTHFTCSTAAFGDPATGTVKTCQCLETVVGTVDLHKFVQCMPPASVVTNVDEPTAKKEEPIREKQDAKPTNKEPKGESKTATGIMIQVEKMRSEPHVDPRAWRAAMDQKYPTWSQKPNPSPSSCKPRNDAFEKLLKKAKIPEKHTGKGPRILCLVYTMASRTEAMETIRETYGADCDGLLFMSTETHPENQELAVHHVGDEAYNNMWQKSRSIWGYVAAMEADKSDEADYFDWFVIGGDDLYVIVDNLRKYVASDEIKEASENGKKPMFLGRRFLDFSKVIFNSGGAGYVLNRASLELFFKHIDTPQCHPDLRHFSEDREVALCLKLHGVEPYDTKDSKHEERFMPFSPELHFSYRAKNYPPTDWYRNYAIDLKEGMESMSEEVISFHYLKPPVMRRLHALLHHCDLANSGDSNWKSCASENEMCDCQTKVRYGGYTCDEGSNCESWKYIDGPTKTICANAQFGGDPVPGVAKHCYCYAGK